MKLDVVHRLIRHYEEMPPDLVATFDWSFNNCASRVLYDWALIDSITDRTKVAMALGISEADAKCLVNMEHRDGSFVQASDNEVHPNAIRMLKFLAENGYVAWPDSTGTMR